MMKQKETENKTKENNLIRKRGSKEIILDYLIK